MSTEGLIGIIYSRLNMKNKPKTLENFIGTYVSSLAFTSSLGHEVVNFIRKVNEDKQWDLFKYRIKRITPVKATEEAGLEEIIKYRHYADPSWGGKLFHWYVLLGKLHGIQHYVEILKGNLYHLIDSSIFIFDKNCSYTYVLNLDNLTLEIYVRRFGTSYGCDNRFAKEVGAIKGVFPFEKISPNIFPKSII